MSTGTIVLLSILFLLIVIIIIAIKWIIKTYNQLQVMKNKIEEAYHNIDVELQRRWDLINNLVETVKGYAKHEKEIWDKFAEARGAAQNAKSPKDLAAADNMFTQALKSLLLVVEKYPELKADKHFTQLMNELRGVEDQVKFARKSYNDMVYQYNKSISLFPTNIVAKHMGFEKMEYFTIEEEEMRHAPKVKF